MDKFSIIHNLVRQELGEDSAIKENGEIFLVESQKLLTPDEAERVTPSETTVARNLATMSRPDFADKLAELGHIKDEEAEAWAGGSAIPKLIADAIDQQIADGNIETSHRRTVRISALTQSHVNRLDVLAIAFANAVGLDESQLDAVFNISTES